MTAFPCASLASHWRSASAASSDALAAAEDDDDDDDDDDDEEEEGGEFDVAVTPLSRYSRMMLSDRRVGTTESMLKTSWQQGQRELPRVTLLLRADQPAMHS